MKQFILYFILLILFFPSNLFGQKLTLQDSSEILHYYFPISADDAANLLGANEIPEDWKWDFDKAIAIPNKVENRSPSDTLEYGQYISAAFDDQSYERTGKIEHKIIFKHSFTVNILQNGSDVYAVLMNLKGNKIQADKITLKGEQLIFNEKIQGYLLNKPKENDVVKICLKNQYAIYHLDDNDRRSKWQKFKLKPIGKILITYPKKAVVGFLKLFKKRNKHISNGYIVLNKPKYQLLDTVKTSAYFVHEHNGKPYEKPIRIVIGIFTYYRGNSFRDTLIDRKIYPTSPGRYNYDFVIGDSVKVDKEYVVSYQFGNKKNKYKNHFETKRLYIEDYELDEVKYSFKASKTKYEKDEKIILKSSAKYTTGKSVPDVTMKLLLLPFTVDEYLKDELILPDTLWQHQLTLKYDALTQIVIPDSVLPAIKMTIKLKATFNTLNGELQSKEQIIYINQKSELENKKILTFKYENGKIKGQLMRGYSSLNAKAELMTYFIGNIKTIKEINLPFEKEVSANVREYNLKHDDHRAIQLMLDRQFNGINLDGSITRDSFQFTIKNQLKNKITYQLFYENELLEKGMITDSIFEYQSKTLGYGNYKIVYGYIWAGNSILQNATYSINPNQLKIVLEQPEEIEPGKEINVKITAKDQDGNPAKNVAITASALSSKFNANLSDVFNAPSFPEVKRKKINTHYTFDADYWTSNRTKYTEINTLLENKLQLKTSREYRISHPENGHYTEYVPLPEGMEDFPQFAPFIIDEGRAKKVYAIYGDRQAIYFHDAHNDDYSFIISKGFHRIEIRTNDASYLIDSVEFKKGYKLFLSIDEEKAQKGQLKNVLYRPAKKKWSKAEIRSRQNSLMILKNAMDDYIWGRNGKVTHVRYGNQLIGPFTRNSQLNIARNRQFKKTFLFEPGYQYTIMNNRERLHEYSFVKRDKKTKFWQEYEDLDITNLAMTASQVEYTPPLEYKAAPFSKLYHDFRLTTRKSTKLRIENNKENPLLIALIDATSTPFLFNPQSRMPIKGMSEGKYELLVFYKDGFISKNITLKNNATTFLRLNKEPLQTLNFKEKTKAVFGNLFDWENSIFNEEEKLFLGILEEVEKDDFLERVEERIVELDSMYAIKLEAEGKRLLKGVITDDMGEPLIGATVYIEESGIGIITDYDGSYEMVVPEGIFELHVSYTGYETQIIEVGNNRFRNDVALVESSMGLDGIIVTAVSKFEEREPSKMKRVHAWVMDDIVPEAARNSEGKLDRISECVLDGIAVGLTYEDAEKQCSAFMSSGGSYASKGMLNDSLDEDHFDTEAYLLGEYIEAGNVSLTSAFNNSQLRQNFSDYAYWQNNLITDENGETYFSAVLPDDITGWTSYAIGMDNQQRHGIASKEFSAFKKLMAQLSIPRFAVEGDEFEIIGQSTNYTPDSFRIKTEFLMDEEIIFSNAHWLKNNALDKILIKIPSEKDSLKITYRLAAENSSDGEKRPLKINKQGTIESKGEFVILKNNDDLNFNAQLNAPIKIVIQDNKMDMLMQSLEQLKNYEYGCNEQTASKLIALLLEKEIKEKMGKKFNGERNILKGISKLEKAQNEDGSWGWWSENEGINWITLYAIEALQMANKMDYKTNIQNSLNFIARRHQTFEPADQLKAIYILQQDGTAIDSTEIMKNDTMELSIPEFLLFNLIKQKAAYKTDLDSIQKMMVTTTYGGQHITSDKKYWYYDDINATLLAYDIFKEAKDSNRVAEIENYFYKNRTQYGWTNTIHAAQILKRLLSNSPDLKSDAKIIVDGKEIKKFPYQAEFNADNISISHSGLAPHFVSIYQEEHIKNPKEKSDIFEVKTVFKQENKIVEKLQKSTATQLEVNITAKEEGEYTMIEIPIPSGCSYGEKIQNKSQGIESHREYHKDKVLIFCTRLPQGENTFTINLEPRYTGKFILNPVKVEEMYAPVIFGRNEVNKLNIN